MKLPKDRSDLGIPSWPVETRVGQSNPSPTCSRLGHAREGTFSSFPSSSLFLPRSRRRRRLRPAAPASAAPRLLRPASTASRPPPLRPRPGLLRSALLRFARRASALLPPRLLPLGPPLARPSCRPASSRPDLLPLGLLPPPAASRPPPSAAASGLLTLPRRARPPPHRLLAAAAWSRWR
nr:lysine-rich arabinogalactan protein 19-like [Lolium perenne]